jgi:hypothetical protein
MENVLAIVRTFFYGVHTYIVNIFRQLRKPVEKIFFIGELSPEAFFLFKKSIFSSALA